MIGDDHAMVAEGFRGILEEHFEVVAVVSDGQSLVEEALSSRPDVVLVDISMPIVDGLEAARVIRQQLPETKIIFLTMHADLSYLRDALALGASGYLLKHAAGRELMVAVRDVVMGRIFVSPELTRTITDPRLRKAIEEGTIPPLTGRQAQIIRLIASGLSNSEVASELEITTRTVQFHRGEIAKKLGITGTAALTRYALKHGLIGP